VANLNATPVLRLYSPADFEALYEIDQACYPPEVAYSRRELRNYLRFPGAECVVAENVAESVTNIAGESRPAPEIIGFCITAHHHCDGYIVTMDVLAAYRRHHVGSALLTEAERRVAAKGVTEIGLETATDSDSAIAFWEKHGYRKLGVRKHYYPGGRDAFSMAKTIQT
jgi:[ribosomal protein S18]-alanine N-acetyltransferase